MVEWGGLGHYFGFQARATRIPWSPASRLAAVGLTTLLLQFAYGAFTAGQRAGHVSNTWPSMLGRLIPWGLLQQTDPPLMNLIEAPFTVAFVHRWLAAAMLLIAAAIVVALRRVDLDTGLRCAIQLIIGLSALQMRRGISVVVSHVNTALALLHQLSVLALFVLVVFVLHRFRAHDGAVRDRRKGIWLPLPDSPDLRRQHA